MPYFTYLGCDITYENEDDKHKKLDKFQHMCGNSSKTLKRRTRKGTQLNLYKVKATPSLRLRDINLEESGSAKKAVD